jgi:hypothetical protein
MGIGASISLVTVGAILAFATNFNVSAVDLQVVGIILMASGGVGLLLALAVWTPPQRLVDSRPYYDDSRPYYDDSRAYEESRTTEGGPMF